MTISTTSSRLAVDPDVQRMLFTDARSAMNFADAPVDPALIAEVFDLIKWGPTGNNSVPLRLAIAASPEARRAVIAAANPGNRPRLERAPLIVVVARDERYHDHFSTTAPGAEAVAERLEADPADRAMRATSGTWIQLGYLIVGLRAAGLAVRPYGGFAAQEVNDALFADSAWRAQVLLGVGYPTDDHGAGARKGRVGSDLAVREF